MAWAVRHTGSIVQYVTVQSYRVIRPVHILLYITLVTNFPDEDLIKLINLGKGVMPSFRHLGDEEKAALVAFLTEKDDVTIKHTEENSDMPYTFYRLQQVP
jgi:hypothetical protein